MRAHTPTPRQEILAQTDGKHLGKLGSARRKYCDFVICARAISLDGAGEVILQPSFFGIDTEAKHVAFRADMSTRDVNVCASGNCNTRDSRINRKAWQVFFMELAKNS